MHDQPAIIHEQVAICTSETLASIIVGSITAVYVDPAAHTIMRPVIDFTGVEADAANSLGGFLIGVGGILVSGFPIDL